MSKNRLNLDFSLSTNSERALYIQQYLTDPQFTQTPPTPAELEMLANYLLWGKDPKTGKNVVQDKSIQIESRNSTWSTPPVESFDALIESPTFNEAQFTHNANAPTHAQKKTFSRTEARSQCPPHLLSTFEDLWHRIDIIELSIVYYELKIGKRKLPPRPALLSRFSEEERFKIQNRAESWNLLQYSKQRHLLVELRREQYTLRDTYQTSLLPNLYPTLNEDEPRFDITDDLIVLPLGLKTEKTSVLFKPKNQLNPFSFSENELGALSKTYWTARKHLDSQTEVAPSSFVIDLRKPEHIASLLSKYNDVLPDVEGADPIIRQLYDTLFYYIDFTELDPIQADLVHLKLHKKKINTEIAAYLNSHYGRAYTPNYISTIFRQRIIPQVAQAVSEHLTQIGEIFFPENFKTCTTCGRILLANEANFTHRTRSKDGFSNRCKQCDSVARKKRKGGKS